jgi:Xaa-Pro dipeptidase
MGAMDERIDETARLSALIEAEDRALALLDAIEAAGLVAPGRSERAIERDIRALAEERFGVTRHWHKRVVRAGINTIFTAGDNPPDRVVADDDMVFIDLGPVFEEWEADVGRSYAIGADPRKHALCAALPVVFDTVRDRFNASPDITGQELYAFACESAEAAGWRFGGKIAGHIVGEFPHAHIPAKRITTGSIRQTREGCANPMPSGAFATGYWKSTSSPTIAVSADFTSGCSAKPEPDYSARAGMPVTSWWSSPASHISIMMSEPPTNSPFT